MNEVTTTKNDSNMSEKMYSKDIGTGTLTLEWIPLLVELFFICLLVATAVDIVLHLLDADIFSIRWYLIHDSPFADPALYFLVAFAVSLGEVWRRYSLIKKEPYASVNDENLMLRFGKDSFLWENIQNVDLEGDRKLIITFLDKKMIKRRRFDLKLLQGKEDFIHSLKNNCTARNIPFHESEINFLSRIELFLNLLKQHPFV